MSGFASQPGRNRGGSGGGDSNPAALYEEKRLRRIYQSLIKKLSCLEDVKTKAKLAQQKKVSLRLKAEYASLLEQAKQRNLKHLEKVNSEQVKVRLDKHKEIDKEIKKKRQDLKDIKTQTKNVMDEIGQLCKNGECRENSEKPAENMQVRLDAITTLCNNQIIENEKMVRATAHLLHERFTFRQQFDSLAAELASGKNILYDLIEIGNHAYDNRKFAYSRLSTLKERAMRNLTDNCHEAHKYSNKVDHARKLNSFLAKKNQRRQISIVSESSMSSEEAVEGHPEPELHLTQYTDILGQVQQALGQENMSQLVPAVARLSSDNESSFLFTVELNTRISGLNFELIHLHKSIAEEESSNEEKAKHENEHLESLSKQVSDKIEACRSIEYELASYRNCVNVVMASILSIFKTLDCSSDVINKMLGDNSQVTIDNYQTYMKIIEQRLLDITFVARYQMDHKTPIKGSSTRSFSDESEMEKVTLPSGPCALCAKLKEVSGILDGLVAPINLEELKLTLPKELAEGARADITHSATDCPLPESRRRIQMLKAKTADMC